MTTGMIKKLRQGQQHVKRGIQRCNGTAWNIVYRFHGWYIFANFLFFIETRIPLEVLPLAQRSKSKAPMADKFSVLSSLCLKNEDMASPTVRSGCYLSKGPFGRQYAISNRSFKTLNEMATQVYLELKQRAQV